MYHPVYYSGTNYPHMNFQALWYQSSRKKCVKSHYSVNVHLKKCAFEFFPKRMFLQITPEEVLPEHKAKLA